MNATNNMAVLVRFFAYTSRAMDWIDCVSGWDRCWRISLPLLASLAAKNEDQGLL